MRCNLCGYEIPGHSSFCPGCGRKNAAQPSAAQGSAFYAAPGSLDDASADSGKPSPGSQPYYRPAEATGGMRFSPNHPPAADTPAAERVRNPYADMRNAAESSSVFCPNCGAVKPVGSSVCPSCGQSDAAAYSAPKRTNKKALAWTLAALALALVVIGVVFILRAQADGPTNQIVSALSNTLEAESFSADLSVYRNGELLESAAIQAVIRPKDKELTFVIKDRDYDNAYAVYDGYLIEVRDAWYYDSYSSETRIYKRDISDALDAFFEGYNNSGSRNIDDFDLEEFLDNLDEYTADEIRREIDLDEYKNCVKECANKLNDENWLAEYAGFTKTTKGGKTTYAFELNDDNIAEFSGAILEIFRPAFRVKAHYRELKEELEDFDSDTGTSLRMSFVVEGKNLTSFEFEVETGHGNDNIRIVLDFDDIGSASIDTDELEDWLARAERQR